MAHRRPLSQWGLLARDSGRYISAVAIPTPRANRPSRASPQPEIFLLRLEGWSESTERYINERWRYDGSRHRHEYHYSVNALLDNPEAQPDLRHHHSYFAARNHPNSDTQRIRFAQAQRAESASDELRNHRG